MRYKISVQEIIPLTPEESEGKTRRNNYYNPDVLEVKFHPILDVELNDEEYDAMKKAIIGVKK